MADVVGVRQALTMAFYARHRANPKNTKEINLANDTIRKASAMLTAEQVADAEGLAQEWIDLENCWEEGR